jgi:hypothetical protein
MPPRLCAVAALVVAVLATPDAHAVGKPRVHDNVFFHAGVSLGPSWFIYDAPMNTGTRHEGNAIDFGAGIELALGGTIPGGLVVAGLLRMNGQDDPSFDNPTVMKGWDGATNYVGTIAALARYYPLPAKGLHADAFVGVGYHHTRHEVAWDLFPDECPETYPDCDDNIGLRTFTADERSNGLMLGVGGGYEFWVGKHWSLGPSLRLEYAHTWASQGTYTFLSPSILFGVTYN